MCASCGPEAAAHFGVTLGASGAVSVCQTLHTLLSGGVALQSSGTVVRALGRAIDTLAARATDFATRTVRVRSTAGDTLARLCVTNVVASAVCVGFTLDTGVVCGVAGGLGCTSADLGCTVCIFGTLHTCVGGGVADGVCAVTASLDVARRADLDGHTVDALTGHTIANAGEAALLAT